MIPHPGRALSTAVSVLLAVTTPEVVRAQAAPSEVLLGRTGPGAQTSRPEYARPPNLLPPAPTIPGGYVRLPPDEGPGLGEIRVSVEGAHDAALPPRRWHPADEPDADLRLDYRPGEALDEVWVRRQFTLNRLPADGGVSRALALVQVINRAFLAAGFVNSGVVVRLSAAPDTLDLTIIYGGLVAPSDGGPRLAVVWVNSDPKGLDAAFIRDRMPAALRRPLNAIDLEREFRLLAEDPAIRTVNADLRPGTRPGEASLIATIFPQDRYNLYLTGANNRSPSIGGERAAAGGFVRNLLGAGDILSGEVGITEGVKDVYANYVFPLFSPRTVANVRAAYNDAAVIDPLLTPLDITAKERVLEGGLSRKLTDRPLLPAAEAGRWSSARTLSAGALVSWHQAQTTLLGQPFSFAPGAIDGRSHYTALRLVGDYVVRNVDQVFAVSLTASMGLEGTRSIIVGLTNPDPNFKVALAQVNYARRLSPRGLELRARLYGQMSSGVLYSSERLSAGGETTVRGYRENVLLADQGIVGSVEFAHPLNLAGRQGGARAFNWGAFSVATFADGAVMRNAKVPQPQHWIMSLGTSLTWTPSDAMSARITYGYALKSVEVAGKRDLQDHGVQARLTIYPLRMLR